MVQKLLSVPSPSSQFWAAGLSPGHPPNTREATDPRGESWAFKDVLGSEVESGNKWETTQLPEADDSQFVHVTVPCDWAFLYREAAEL